MAHGCPSNSPLKTTPKAPPPITWSVKRIRSSEMQRIFSFANLPVNNYNDKKWLLKRTLHTNLQCQHVGQ